MPALPPGGLLLAALYLSLDPYMRGRMDDRKSYATPVGIGEAMTGESVCEVIASDRQGYAPGDIVLAHTGWRTHAAWDGPALRKLDPKLAPITTGWACSACPASPPIRGSTFSANRKPARRSSLRRRAGRSARWSGNSPRWRARARSASPAAPEKCRYVRDELRFDACVDHRAADLARATRGRLPEGHRRLFRECRRRGVAGGAAAAQHLRARAGLRAHLPI